MNTLALRLTRTAQALLTLSAAALLVACGSGNNETLAIALVPGTDVPVAATTASTAATDFVRTVVSKGEADTENALVVGEALLAASETDDPVAI